MRDKLGLLKGLTTNAKPVSFDWVFKWLERDFMERVMPFDACPESMLQ